MRVDLISDTPWYQEDDERYYWPDTDWDLRVSASRGRRPLPTIRKPR